ncbi:MULTISPECIES: dTMP kinase [Exiguobacterium]|uniref:dTMP kinase n=1 Tax=Exiguobacterium TaxID=33986 RepID=UPI0004983735|nr:MULTISPECIES: dTMP kinase [Exiguobacterium]KAB2865502.1 MAG: dTMP kinase [Exiguobacterium chiriqhucha]TCI66713.1 dTMP kinase [Exiguobacterium sp. IPCI3]TCI76032.1 dTMP kinase [Exiguobacterium sp. IPCH1]TCI77304.1 dTMP kinase [Exiguobacterium sp. IPBC4]
MKGMFITVEGPDGSGKTTQLQLLVRSLTEKGYEVVVTREPGGTKVGNSIREVLLSPEHDEMTPRVEMMLYAASRAQNIDQVIRPALKRGAIVVCDRFVDASIAYQGYGLQYDLNQILSLNEWATAGIKPDLTFLFDLTPDQASRRMKDRGQLDRIESRDESFHQRVYDGFKKILEQHPDRMVRIDANATIEMIQDEVLDITLERLNERGVTQ